MPRYLVSPWTRGGHVFAETGDHTSDIMFVEAWAQANGYNVKNTGITPWRRSHMTNMVNAFDFDNPDYSLPSITSVRTPEALNEDNWSGNLTLGSLTGPWVGPSKCNGGYSHGNYPAVPYGTDNANAVMDNLVEEGYKEVRGAITEGRYVTIESQGLGLGRAKTGEIIGIAAADKHEDSSQRWILTNSDGNRFGNSFLVQSASDKTYIGTNGRLTKDKSQAQAFIFEYQASGATYTLRQAGAGNGQYLSFTKRTTKKRGNLKCRDTGTVNWRGAKTSFKVFGVNYRS